MKKLMMMVAVVATAASVQAASINWGGYIANSLNTWDIDWYLASGSYMNLIYLGTEAPVGTVTEFDYTTGLTNIGGELLASHTFTAGEIDAFQAQQNFIRTDANGGVNGYWMITIYDPNATADYFGYYVGAVTGESDLSAGGTVMLATGFGPGEFLNAGGQLQVVPEPATGMLALAGAALLLRRRRRA